jgi:hypothetical protein
MLFTEILDGVTSRAAITRCRRACCASATVCLSPAALHPPQCIHFLLQRADLRLMIESLLDWGRTGPMKLPPHPDAAWSVGRDTDNTIGRTRPNQCGTDQRSGG